MTDEAKKTFMGVAINCGNGFPPPGRFLGRTYNDETHFYRIVRYDDTRIHPGVGSRRYVEVERIEYEDLPPVPQPFGRFVADNEEDDPFPEEPLEGYMWDE